MPSTITKIGPACFSGCTELFNNDYSNISSNDFYMDTFFENITEIGASAFVNSGIKDVILGNNITVLGHRAFASLYYDQERSIELTGTKLNKTTSGIELFADNY